MTNGINFSRIGCIEPTKLDTASQSTGLKNCIASSKANNKKYMATDATLSNVGTCYFLKNENETIPWGLDSDRNCSTSGNIPVYNVESNNCSGINNSSSTEDVEKCLDNGGKNYLEAAIRSKADQITQLQDQIKNDRVRIMGITRNLNDSGALTAFEEEQQECQNRLTSRAVAKEVERLRSQYSAWNDAQIKSTDLITKTTTLYDEKNKEQQDKFDKLQNLNKEINTLSKDIKTNQIRYDDKDKVVKILRTILIITIILLACLVIYYGIKVVQKNNPDMYNNMMNKFNNFTPNFGNF